MKKQLFGIAAGVALAIGAASMAGAADTTIGVVVKIGGIPWFNAMEEGITKRAAELGIKAEMIGPVSADPALQVQAIEDLIAKGVDVIGVVPNDEAALEPVLKKARDAGIIVLAHEGPGIANVDWDFELVSTKGLGEAHAKLLAEQMGGKGKFAVYVGSLTVPLHNAWADASLAWLKDNYPDMQQLGDRYGVGEDVDASRSTALDLLGANTDLTGFLAYGSQGPIGAARAIEERHLIDQVSVVGIFSPGQGAKLVHENAIRGGFMWDPSRAGEVFVTLGALLADGQKVEDGMDIPGLGVVHPDFEAHDIITDNLLELSKDTVDELAAKGL